MNEKKILELENISLEIAGKQILKDVSFSINSGEIVIITGENGAGKSTLLSFISGQLVDATGKISLDKNIRKSYVGDKSALYPDWLLSEFLMFFADFIYSDKNQRDNILNQVIKDCALEKVLNKKCRELSHGYRQRAALAQSLINQPDLLLLDELVNGLDIEQKRSFREVLFKIKQKSAVLMVHHDLIEAIYLADRIYDLIDGRLLEIKFDDNIKNDLVTLNTEEKIIKYLVEKRKFFRNELLKKEK